MLANRVLVSSRVLQGDALYQRLHDLHLSHKSPHKSPVMQETFPPLPLFFSYDCYANVNDTEHFHLPGLQRNLCAKSPFSSS
jgi:hypothetical protein